MDQGSPFRQRRAKAIAISQTVEARRKAAIARLAMIFASMAVVFEAALIAHRLWAYSQP